MNAKTPNRRFKASALAVALAGLTLAMTAQAAIIEIGDDTYTSGSNDIAIGNGASATGMPGGAPSIAIGHNANAYYAALAMGASASAGRFGTAVGNEASAGDTGAALGYMARAAQNGSTALGAYSRAQWGGVAVGVGSITEGEFGVAVGVNAESVGGSAALGHQSRATEAGTVSVGNNSLQRRVVNVGFGQDMHDAVVFQQVVPALSGLVSGLGGGATYNPATGVMTAPSYVLSVGTFNNVGSALSAIDAALGGGGGGSTPSPYFQAHGAYDGSDNAQIVGDSGVAAGRLSRAGDAATAIGTEAEALAHASTAVGLKARATGRSSLALGDEAHAAGDSSVAVGLLALTTAERGVAIGSDAHANAQCVSLGAFTRCDEPNTVSVGNVDEGLTSRITQVASGRGANDAANVGQVAPIADAFGGGAGFVNGQFVAPHYGFRDGTNHTDAGTAFDNLDARVWNLENNPGGGGQGPQGPEGPQGPQGIQGADGRSAYEVAVANGFQGNEQEWLESLQGRDGRDGVGGGTDVAAGRNIQVEDNEDGTRSVHLSDVVELSEEGRLAVGGTTVDAQGVRVQGGPSMTRQGLDAGKQRITGVAAGRIERGSTDAVNGGQLWQFQQDVNDRWDQIDNRMANMDRRLDGLCAMGQAQAQASMSSAHIKTRNRVAVGAGYCGSKTALSLGYSRDVTTPRGSPSAFSFGVSTTGQDTAIGAGWAIGW